MSGRVALSGGLERTLFPLKERNLAMRQKIRLLFFFDTNY